MAILYERLLWQWVSTVQSYGTNKLFQLSFASQLNISEKCSKIYKEFHHSNVENGRKIIIWSSENFIACEWENWVNGENKNPAPKYAGLWIQFVNWPSNILSPGKIGGTATTSDSVHL